MSWRYSDAVQMASVRTSWRCRCSWRCSGAGEGLFLGNSMPIRDMDMYACNRRVPAGATSPAGMGDFPSGAMHVLRVCQLFKSFNRTTPPAVRLD